MSRVVNLGLVGARELPRSKRSVAKRMDTIMITVPTIKSWKLPPFQRPLKVNDKVKEVAEELKSNGGVIPGVLTLGELGRETYLIDGQHRIEAYILSELPEGIADVRIGQYQDMGEMAEEFIELNGSIVKMKPDDVLRGLENVMQPLRTVRKACPFIGYDFIRRGPANALISMSAALRCWFGSVPEVPVSGTASAATLAREMKDEDADQMITYFKAIRQAFGSDPEYWGLWRNLNVAVCAWLWRRTVLNQYSTKSIRLTATQFQECATGLSADSQYLTWLVGRQITDRDRSPCYSRVKGIFQSRLKEKLGRVPHFPSPPWTSHHGVRSK
jgi:hypothetical protein